MSEPESRSRNTKNRPSFFALPQCSSLAGVAASLLLMRREINPAAPFPTLGPVRTSVMSRGPRQGSMSLIFTDWIQLLMAAARWPARSLPGRSQGVRPSAMGRMGFSAQLLSAGSAASSRSLRSCRPAPEAVVDARGAHRAVAHLLLMQHPPSVQGLDQRPSQVLRMRRRAASAASQPARMSISCTDSRMASSRTTAATRAIKPSTRSRHGPASPASQEGPRCRSIAMS